jgi:hypothetical protein
MQVSEPVPWRTGLDWGILSFRGPRCRLPDGSAVAHHDECGFVMSKT